MVYAYFPQQSRGAEVDWYKIDEKGMQKCIARVCVQLQLKDKTIFQLFRKLDASK